MPERRNRELRPRRLDDGAGRQPSEQMTLEEVFLRAPPSVCYRRRGADRLLEREQPFQYADRRVEGRAHRAALRLAVPAAVHELFAQQSIDEPIAARPEVRAERQDAAVDADRKSTRLNSSHSQISYAVFCLKKKKKREIKQRSGLHVVRTG